MDVRCPNDGEMTNERCWKCGWMPGGEQLPGGWMDGLRLKPKDKYLSHVVWVGEAEPEHYMGFPWGLGGECWWTCVLEGADGESPDFTERKVFAGMDRDEVSDAARKWAEDGYPWISAS
jgi:hypothetical protein